MYLKKGENVRYDKILDRNKTKTINKFDNLVILVLEFLGRKYERYNIAILKQFFVTFIAILFLPWARNRDPLLFLLGERRKGKSLLASARSFEQPQSTPRDEENKNIPGF